MILRFKLVFIILLLFSCNNQSNTSKKSSILPIKDSTRKDEPLRFNKQYPLERIRLPKGFKIEIIAQIEDARSLTVSKGGNVYVGSRGAGTVFAIIDTNNNNIPDKEILIRKGLNTPNGIAFKDESLYVSEPNRVLKFENIENHLEIVPEPKVIFSGFPELGLHSWRYSKFGPDGLLYIGIGANCDLCVSDNPLHGTIIRIDESGQNLEVVAKGVRNTVGFDWHPNSGELWFTENGPNNLGKDYPPDEVNKIENKGEYFGFPTIYGISSNDSIFNGDTNLRKGKNPEFLLQAHTAPLGMIFYDGEQFPDDYNNNIFIARHGSSRQKGIGYDIVRIDISKPDNKAEIFASGWSSKEDDMETWGRPVDIIQIQDGSLLVSDDFAGLIYRVWYNPENL
jgi:glucose/arabinose dehydrogenase